MEQNTSCTVCGAEVPDAATKKKNWYFFNCYR